MQASTTMQALVLRKEAPHLSITSLPIPEVPPGHVRVRVEAAALNRRDVWISEGRYAGIVYPSVLGSDGAGVIDTVGDGVASDMAGMHVVINPSMDWGSDPRAQSDDYHILGMPSHGTFAEYVVVPASQCHLLPAHLTMVQGAAVPLAGLTAYRAVVTQGAVISGQHVLVTGAGGGVSSWTLLFARAQGAQVYVTSRREESVARAVEAGAAGGLAIRGDRWTKEYIERFGMPDCIIDGIGGDFMSSLLQVCSPGGTIVCYGATLGAVSSFELRRVFWKQIRLVGSTMGTNDEFSRMISCIETHSLVPTIDSVRPFSEIIEAFARMKESEHAGKIVVRMTT